MPKPPPHPHAARLLHPEVIAKVRATITGSFPKHLRDDVEQGTMLRLLLLQELPPDHDGLLGMTVVMTKRELIDQLRRQRVHDRHAPVDADLLEEVQAIQEPATGFARAELAQFMARVEEQLAAGNYRPEVKEALRLVLAKEASYTEAADAHAVPVSTLKSAMARLRRDMIKRWPAYTAAAVMVGAVLAVLFLPPGHGSSSGGDIGPDQPPPAGSFEKDADTDYGWMTPKELREHARAACNDVEIDLCEHYLDLAKKKDPDGEFDPGVKDLRDAIARARWKPSYLWPEAGGGGDENR
jgi:DNA-directed RNA polymerase specialized sigma24 family protein